MLNAISYSQKITVVFVEEGSRKHRFSEYTDILYYIMLYRVHLNVYQIYSHTLLHTVVSSTPQLLMAEGTD
jgi:hypothetical protein